MSSATGKHSQTEVQAEADSLSKLHVQQCKPKEHSSAADKHAGIKVREYLRTKCVHIGVRTANERSKAGKAVQISQCFGGCS
jgi:hypothetical protein